MNTITISPLINNISISGASTSSNGIISVSGISSPVTTVTVLQGIQGQSGTSVAVSNYGIERLLISDNSATGVIGLSGVTANNSGIYISGIIVSLSGHNHVLSDIPEITASFSEINYLNGSVPGTGSANNAIILDNYKNIDSINRLVNVSGVTSVLSIRSEIFFPVNNNDPAENYTYGGYSDGVTQTKIYHLSNKTTTANPQGLYLNRYGTSWGNTYIIPLPTGSMSVFNAIVSAYNITDKQGSSWNIQGAIQHSSGLYSIVGTPVSTGWYPSWGSGSSVYPVAINASGFILNSGLAFTIIGLSNKTIIWSCGLTINTSSY